MKDVNKNYTLQKKIGKKEDDGHSHVAALCSPFLM